MTRAVMISFYYFVYELMQRELAWFDLADFSRQLIDMTMHLLHTIHIIWLSLYVRFSVFFPFLQSHAV